MWKRSEVQSFSCPPPLERCAKPQPGHRVQVDVKFIQPLPGARKRKHYQFTAIDDCTRLRVLRSTLAQPDDRHPVPGLVLERLPFRVEVIQTDSAAEFGSSFHRHVLDKGIGHVYIKPRTPS
jgi:hypothetical protein